MICILSYAFIGSNFVCVCGVFSLFFGCAFFCLFLFVCWSHASGVQLVLGLLKFLDFSSS